MSTRRGRSRTPQALRASLNERLRNAASRGEASAAELRKQFVFALLYRRLFSDDDGSWLLLGGNALIIRTGGGRFTQDVDLSRARAWENEDELKEELEEIFSRDVGDPFTFVVRQVDPHDHLDPYGYGTRTAKAYITVLLGGVVFDAFAIDLSQRRHVDGPVDRLRPVPVVEHELLEGLPSIPVIPVENHTADKICAMYEVHQQPTPWSTRYRDLADLVRIVKDLEIDAGRLTAVLRHEQRRRRIPELPRELCPPHDSWATAYPKAARTYAEFPAAMHPLEASLDYAGRCLNVVLSGTRLHGVWDPAGQRWREEIVPSAKK